MKAASAPSAASADAIDQQAGSVAQVMEMETSVNNRGDGVDKELIVRRAAALRFKYRKSEGVRVPVEQIGFHPMNRDGHGPSGERCISLLQDLIKIGYDQDEADAREG